MATRKRNGAAAKSNEGRAARKTNGRATKRKLNPIPKGYRTVTPTLNQADAKATIAFCRKAFGAKLKGKIGGPKGKLMHAEIEIGNSIVMLSDAVMEPARPASLFLYVEDVDKTMAKAVKAGAKVVMPADDMFWGDRFGSVEDPQGNRWGIGSRIEKVTDVELKKRARVAAKEMATAMAATG
ncbi:MAG: VOC family protein [Myxococcales bacterium]|nr:VOC family protein [Myxococcales bacterium]